MGKIGFRRFLAISASLLSCALWAQRSEAVQRFHVSLERTSCYGSCPVYWVELNGDGTGTYEGYKYVRVKGRQPLRIKTEDIKRLQRKIEDIGFFQLEDEYVTKKWVYRDPVTGEEKQGGTVVSDLPTQYVSVTWGNRSKVVKDYAFSPEGLRELEKVIDEIAGVKRFIFLDVPTVKKMLNEGLPAQKKLAFLREAIDQREHEVALAILDSGVSVAGEGLLDLASYSCNKKVVEALIRSGANVHEGDRNGNNLLYNAAGTRDVECYELLLNSGLDVNGSNPSGYTPLMNAVNQANPEVVNLLIAHGADKRIRTAYGTIAANTAQRELEQARKRSDEDGKKRVHRLEQIVTLLADTKLRQ